MSNDWRNELVTKGAAIDAQEAYMADHPLDGYEDELALIDILRNLPSAQPEIIRCKDCREFRRWIDTDITFCDLTESERDALDFCSRAERRTDGVDS